MKFTKENIISQESKVRSQECSSGFYDQERFRHYYSFNDNFPQSSYRTANEIIKNILNLRSSHSIEPLHCDKTKYGGMSHYHSNENQHNGTGSELSTPGVYELPYPKPYQQINQKADREPGDTDGEKTISQLTNIETEDQMQPGSQLPGVVWNPVFLSKPMKSERVDEVTCKRCPNCMKHKAAPERRELLKYICPKNDKEFVCLYKNCGKNFTRRYNILSHIQTHLNIRQFTCKVCFKSFVRRHDLNRHSKSHLSPRKYENVFSSMVRARPRSEWSDYEIVIDDGRCTCG